jgi:hypothetical protein
MNCEFLYHHYPKINQSVESVEKLSLRRITLPTQQNNGYFQDNAIFPVSSSTQALTRSHWNSYAMNVNITASFVAVVNAVKM